MPAQLLMSKGKVDRAAGSSGWEFGGVPMQGLMVVRPACLHEPRYLQNPPRRTQLLLAG